MSTHEFKPSFSFLIQKYHFPEFCSEINSREIAVDVSCKMNMGNVRENKESV